MKHQLASYIMFTIYCLVDMSTNQRKHPLAPEELGKLYPVPKTYDQKLEERAALNRLHEKRLPKMIALRSCLLLTFLLLMSAMVVYIAPGLLTGNPMFGVPIVVFAAIVIIMFAMAVVRHISYLHYAHGKSALLLLVGALLLASMAIKPLFALDLVVIAWVSVIYFVVLMMLEAVSFKLQNRN